MEFEKVIPEMLNVVINMNAVRDHVGEVEQCIRIVKEQALAIISTLPFKHVPNVMTISSFLCILIEHNSN